MTSPAKSAGEFFRVQSSVPGGPTPDELMPGNLPLPRSTATEQVHNGEQNYCTEERYE
jgi:hypothetical protein